MKGRNAGSQANFAELCSINPYLLLSVFISGDMQLWGSNLIIEYLLKTYPDIPTVSPKPPLVARMTRPIITGRTPGSWQPSRR
jgi:glutathione S-transferase